VRKFLAAILLAAGLAAPAGATCTFTGGVLPLEIPTLGDSGSTWAACLQRNFEKISVGGGGHFIEKDGAPIVQRATMNFVGAGVSVVDNAGKTEVTVLAVPGDILRSTATYISETGTNSTAWETVIGSTQSIYSELTTFLELELSCNLACDTRTACPVVFGALLDGDYFDDITASTDSAIMFVKTDGTNINSPEPLNFKYRTKEKVSASTHTVSLLWASIEGADITLGRGIGSGCTFKVGNDLNAINSGSAANVSGVNDLGAVTLTFLETASCPVLPCRAQANDFDLYTATAAATPGAWRNTRTGASPADAP